MQYVEEGGAYGSRSTKAQSVQEAIGRYTAEFNDPDPDDIIDEAVGIIVKECNPRAVWIYGPAAHGYVDDRKINILVVIDRGNTRKVWGDLIWALAYEHIDGDIAVFTASNFEKYKTDSYSRAYDAVKTGILAYERR